MKLDCEKPSSQSWQITSPLRYSWIGHNQLRNCVDGKSFLVVSTREYPTQLERWITSSMCCTETIRVSALTTRKKTTSLRASTTPHYTEHLHYPSLIKLSLAITSPFLLWLQICKNINAPLLVTSHTQLVNRICAEAVAKQLAITTLMYTKKMIPVKSSSAILNIPSCRILRQQTTCNKNQRAPLSHKSI